jgi:hypothetical protein
MNKTPGPWKAEGIDIYGMAPATVRPHIARVIYGGHDDAAFIVAACNSHDALLDACKTMVKRWMSIYGALSIGGNGTYDAGNPDSLVREIDKLEAAIAKATAKP